MVLCQSASDSLIFICTTAGTTAIQQPSAYQTVTDGNTVTDGTAVFKAVSVSGQIAKLSKTEVLASNAQQMIAPILSSLVAPSGGLESGDQFIYNGLLYKATAAIAQGGTIIINGNCTLANSVTEQMNELETGVIVTYEYGTLTYVYNALQKRCAIRWTGNDSAPSVAIVSVQIPQKLIPNGINPFALMFQGNFIEIISNNLTLNFSPTTLPWSASYIEYFTV
jgi:hypothetical protein